MLGTTIHVKSPTRVDLAGGTLDMWPLYNFLGSALTINLAIDIWTKVEIKPRATSGIKIHSLDLKKEWEFSEFSTFFSALDPYLHLYQKVFEKFSAPLINLKFGFELITSSESPIGGGLGGSSSLVISILKATHQLLEIKMPATADLVFLAHNIEAEILKTPTGTQDYFPAVTGGLSFIDYTATGTKQTLFPIAGTPLEDHFLLVYTGRSHHSGLNNFEVLKSCVEGDLKVLSALEKIKDIALKMKECIQQKSWHELPKLFQMEFDARIELTPAFSSPEIEKLAKICVAAGALAVKICGAGGGGCVLVWVPPQQRERVIQVCQNEKFQCLNARPVNPL
ncbi:MAG: galactokinase [Bdellovibrio sp.]|nr:galactokinase [Bdellovibrio sp.]